MRGRSKFQKGLRESSASNRNYARVSVVTDPGAGGKKLANEKKRGYAFVTSGEGAWS